MRASHLSKAITIAMHTEPNPKILKTTLKAQNHWIISTVESAHWTVISTNIPTRATRSLTAKHFNIKACLRFLIFLSPLHKVTMAARFPKIPTPYMILTNKAHKKGMLDRLMIVAFVALCSSHSVPLWYSIR